MDDAFKQCALEYHRASTPGKIFIAPTKSLANQEGATTITESMKMACVHALAALAEEVPGQEVSGAYPGQSFGFGSEYLIPNPFTPRLITHLAPAATQAAMDAGVARRPIADMAAFRSQLAARRFVFSS